MSRFFRLPVFTALMLVTAAPAFAQWGRPNAWPSNNGRPYAEARRAAYDNGFREGLKEGDKDGRQRDRFEYRDERDFQRADTGYHRNFGDVERYRQSFRAGFVDGYSQAYGRYNRGGNGYDRDYRSPAFENGARDGFEMGREDARDNDRFDPRRHKWYREGDRHYDRRFGPREVYEDEYRRGFLAGYDQGFREGRYR